VLEVLDSGSHVVCMDDVYGGTYRLFERVRRRSAGLDFSFVDLTDLGRVGGRDPPEHADGLVRDADQPDAEDRRHRRGSRSRAREAAW
jgi:hypothetical protein